MICKLFVAHPPNCVELYCLFLQHWIISDHLTTVVFAATMACEIGLKKSLSGNTSKLITVAFAYGDKLRLILER